MREKENRENFLQKGWAVCLLALVCCALWGSAFPSIKIGYRLFAVSSDDTATQILFAGCRFFGAGFLTILLGSILNRRILVPGKTAAGKIMALSMVQTVLQYLFFYVGLAHTTGVKGSIITGLNTFFFYFTGMPSVPTGEADNEKTGWLFVGICGRGSSESGWQRN